ncbi:hypothetical protein ACFL59_00340 [Planctomycetota bacterium]
MYLKQFNRIMAARDDMFRHDGHIVNPTTLTYDPQKPYVLFPDIRCVYCETSLVTHAKAGLMELRVKIANQWTRAYLSIFLEDYFIGFRDADVVFEPGQIPSKVTCHDCNRSLFHEETSCRRCDERLIRLDLHTIDNHRFVMDICSRRACHAHYVELKERDFKRLFLRDMFLRSPEHFEPL